MLTTNTLLILLPPPLVHPAVCVLVELRKVIYVATDEPQRDFFQPLADIGYDVVLWGDLIARAKKRMPKLYTRVRALLHDRHHCAWKGDLVGMLEQMILLRATLFDQTAGSTYSATVTRLRGHPDYQHMGSIRPVAHGKYSDATAIGRQLYSSHRVSLIYT